MRVLASGIFSVCFILFVLVSPTGASLAQDGEVHHVYIPNPTPRDPDLKQVFDNTPANQKKQQEILLKNQLRAREIWLQSNQILLLAQQLQQEVLSGNKPATMSANAAKAAEIEKLAKSVQEKMRTR